MRNGYLVHCKLEALMKVLHLWTESPSEKLVPSAFVQSIGFESFEGCSMIHF